MFHFGLPSFSGYSNISQIFEQSSSGKNRREFESVLAKQRSEFNKFQEEERKLTPGMDDDLDKAFKALEDEVTNFKSRIEKSAEGAKEESKKFYAKMKNATPEERQRISRNWKYMIMAMKTLEYLQSHKTAIKNSCKLVLITTVATGVIFASRFVMQS